MEKIIPIWQPLGYSTHVIAKKIAEKLNTKTSHTGTLDPMAEGVVIVLTGEDRLKKYEYAGWEKEYQFGVLFGIATDSFDGLGLPEIAFAQPTTEEIKEVVSKLIGEYKQEYPVFSAKKILGKPLHFFARNNKLSEIEIPIKEGEIYGLDFIGVSEINLEEICREVISKVSQTSGDLRQDTVKEAWKKLLSENDKKQMFLLAEFKVKMSKGLYVRGLVRDMAKELGVAGFTFYINRIRNGEYKKENSNTLEQIFGLAFDKNDFVSRS